MSCLFKNSLTYFKMEQKASNGVIYEGKSEKHILGGSFS